MYACMQYPRHNNLTNRMHPFFADICENNYLPVHSLQHEKQKQKSPIWRKIMSCFDMHGSYIEIIYA